MKKIENLDELRKKILELYARGFSNEDIKKTMEENSDYNVSTTTVKNVVKEFKTKTTQVLIEDDKMRVLVEENLTKIIKCANDNLEVLENIRAKVLDKLDSSEGDERMLLSYLREISGSIRTQNDSIRTINSLLSSLKDTTKETEVSSVADISKTVSILKDLEKDGFIKIMPAYFNSGMYKAQAKIEENKEMHEAVEQPLFN